MAVKAKPALHNYSSNYQNRLSGLHYETLTRFQPANPKQKFDLQVYLHISTEKTGNLRINVTPRRVSATTVAVGNQYELRILSDSICSLRYPGCNAHAPYCHLWPVWLLPSFSTLSHKQNAFRGKKVIPYKILPEIFLIIRRIQWRFRWSRGCVLASNTQVRGFKYQARLPSEVK
jgi:hypothetical protein